MHTLDFNKLYNSDIKRQFIEDITINNDSRKTFYYMFVKTAKVEFEKSKDLFEMVTEELEEAYQVMKARTVTSAANYISNIYKYLEWAIENGYTSSNLKDFEENIRGGYAEKFVSKSLTSYYTKEDLYEFFKDMDYVGDQAILLCMFEGIRGKGNSEIANMKVTDLKEIDNKYFIDLYDSEKGTPRENFEISRDLYYLLLNLADTKSYTDKRGTQIFLEETPYIFRRSIVGRKSTSDKVNSSFFMNKTVYYKKVFGNKNLQLKDIETSGMMYYLNEWLKEKGERKATNELLERLADKYSTGIYMHSLTKEKTYSYSKIRERIDVEFFEENYGEFSYVN